MIARKSAILIVLFVCATAAGTEIIVSNTSSWKWLHPTEGIDPAETDEDFHSSFYLMDFKDSRWTRGTDKPGPHGGFGYGDSDFEGIDIQIPNSTDNRKTAYFRHKFATDRAYHNLVLHCQRDDAIIVYVDGKEVVRDNLRANAKEAYDLFAEETTSSTDETKVFAYKIKGSLTPGKHILSISLHNRGGGSSDLRIAEISLTGEVGGEVEQQTKK